MSKLNLTFRELRNYYDKLGKLSICIKETMSYKNFMRIADVPDCYDKMYVYGFGMIDSEFTNQFTGELEIERCVEFLLTDTPKDAPKDI